MKDVLKALLPGLGGIAAAGASALCCAGPFLAVTAGASGAALSARLEPLRPWFLGGTAFFLLLGFWLLSREERRACEPGRPCADPVVRRRMRIGLWVATWVSVALATFPRWQDLVS